MFCVVYPAQNRQFEAVELQTLRLFDDRLKKYGALVEALIIDLAQRLTVWILRRGLANCRQSE